MAESLEVDPIILKLIQLIEQGDDATRELKPRTDGNCTCIKILLEQTNGHIISVHMKPASNDLNSFETQVGKICN